MVLYVCLRIQPLRLTSIVLHYYTCVLRIYYHDANKPIYSYNIVLGDIAGKLFRLLQ